MHDFLLLVYSDHVFLLHVTSVTLNSLSVPLWTLEEKAGLCLLTVPKLTAALAESGCIDEVQMSTDQLDASYGPLRELVSESVHQQEAILERLQVSVGAGDAGFAGVYCPNQRGKTWF